MVVRTRVVKLHLINPKTTICSFDNEVDVKIYQGVGQLHAQHRTHDSMTSGTSPGNICDRKGGQIIRI
jgi:hypothetical protein